MHRFLAVLVLLLLAGCTGRGEVETQPTTQDQSLVPVGNAPQEPTPRPETMNLTQEPVHIQESGTLLNGASKQYSWHVAPGYQDFQVRLHLKGLHDAPALVVTAVDIILQGGDPPEEYERRHVALFLGTAHCVVCYDGSAAAKQAGAWQLTFQAGPSPAAYDLEVLVSY